MKESKIQYGFQFRDDEIGVIVNWYPKKGTVYVQKNDAGLFFPKQAFSKQTLVNSFRSVNRLVPNIPKEGICSDAGTHGNPGFAECQVADLSGTILLHEKLGIRTNNYAELFGILRALEYAIKNKIKTIWTDSAVSLAWIKSLKLGKTVHNRDEILEIATKINQLAKLSSVEIKKWLTDKWGEIPADFGRK